MPAMRALATFRKRSRLLPLAESRPVSVIKTAFEISRKLPVWNARGLCPECRLRSLFRSINRALYAVMIYLWSID